MHFLTNVTLDRDLLLEFFLTFARFEFALKAAGFIRAAKIKKNSHSRGLKPDWDRFAKTLDLAHVRQGNQAAEAIDQFLVHPPWRQTLTALGASWDSTVPFTTPRHTADILSLVRRVRNNLFHGGKFTDQTETRTNRDEKLLRHSLTILHRCLELSPAVADHYDHASLGIQPWQHPSA